ncbi:MAG: hypothetical protein ABJE95_31565 [Byssovorax sp.]
MLIPDKRRFQAPAAVPLKWRPISRPHPARRGLSQRRRPETFKPGKPAEEVGKRLVPVPSPEKWLEDLYRLCTAGKRGPAVDLVLYTFDELLFLRDVPTCNDLLRRVDVELLFTEVALAFLMETFRARSALEERDGFYRRLENKLQRESPDRVVALLGRLR